MTNLINQRISIPLLFLLLVCTTCLAQQPPKPVLLGDFFKKLKTVRPYEGKITYDTVPGFNFYNFTPSRYKTGGPKNHYVLGTSAENELKVIIFFKENFRAGVMSVFDLGEGIKILIYNTDSLEGRIPAVPLFCISPAGQYVVHLNKPFYYGQSYKPSDVEAIEILRDDLYPECVLTVWKEKIPVVSSIEYREGDPTFIDHVWNYIIYHPNTKSLKLTTKSFFTLYDMPRADFFILSRPYLKDKRAPLWQSFPPLSYEEDEVSK